MPTSTASPITRSRSSRAEKRGGAASSRGKRRTRHVLDFLAKQYHLFTAPNLLRKIRHRIARRILESVGVAYPRPGKIYPNITEITSCAVPATTVFIAHPDDEVFCSGLLSKLARRGAPITLCCFTRGEGGFTGGHSRKELGSVREKELREAARHLGIDDVRFLDYVDPEITAYRTYAPRYQPRELRSKIADIIRETEPRIVLTHGSCGEYWHPAHIALHDQVRRAVRNWNSANGSPARLLTFNAWDPSHPLLKYLNEGDCANFTLNASDFHDTRLQSIEEHLTQREVFEIFGGGSLEDFVTVSAHESYHVAI